MFRIGRLGPNFGCITDCADPFSSLGPSIECQKAPLRCSFRSQRRRQSRTKEQSEQGPRLASFCCCESRLSPTPDGRTDGARLCASLARSSAALGRQIVTSGQLLRRLRRRSLTRTMDAAAVLIAVAFFVVLLQDVSIGEYKTQLSRWQPSATSSSWS